MTRMRGGSGIPRVICAIVYNPNLRDTGYPQVRHLGWDRRVAYLAETMRKAVPNIPVVLVIPQGDRNRARGWAEDAGVPVVEGPPEDVAESLHRAAVRMRADAVIRIPILADPDAAALRAMCYVWMRSRPRTDIVFDRVESESFHVDLASRRALGMMRRIAPLYYRNLIGAGPHYTPRADDLRPRLRIRSIGPRRERAFKEAMVRLRWVSRVDLGFTQTPSAYGDRSRVLGWLPELRRKSVLEVGPGDGQVAFEMERRGARVTTLEMFHRGGWPGFRLLHRFLRSRVRCRWGNVEGAGFPSGERFDIVVCMGVLYHVANPDLVIRRLALATKDTLLLESVCADTREPVAYWTTEKDLTQMIYMPQIPSVGLCLHLLSHYGFKDVRVMEKKDPADVHEYPNLRLFRTTFVARKSSPSWYGGWAAEATMDRLSRGGMTEKAMKPAWWKR